MLSPEDVGIIQKSFTRILPVSNAAVYVYFSKLLELNPELEVFLGTDLLLQEHRYFGVLLFVVNRLQNIELLRPMMEDFGRECKAAHLQIPQVECFGEALEWTLEQTLRSAFTGAVRNAWHLLITDLMQFVYDGFNNYILKRKEFLHPAASSSRTSFGMLPINPL